ncbi:polysaccharide deacetylase family protein [Streptacidiphilus sp. PB12-B1b]|uniref:polysaccharide deacetylase family protein n=1 Tax=Streptacidiphilus sp. PB12-B1b TaxID=2705012 RepID=UPI0015FB6EBE|nr:polysaccharide deacetylase family protein [Streptacidiphilus sp. PB12-B1b]QMU76673.1 polysaccharide deacetylase family protein [Streptacidiphilus sp. PB12-B1b]
MAEIRMGGGRTRRSAELAEADRAYADVLADPGGGAGLTGGQVSRRVMLSVAGVTLLSGCGGGGTAVKAGASTAPIAVVRSSPSSPSAPPAPSAGAKVPTPRPSKPVPHRAPIPVQSKPQYYVDAGPKVIALTLDDGPSQYTAQILEILREHRITATFCMLGQQIAQYAGIVKEVAAAGHRITNHTWDHADQTKLSLKAVTDEIDRTNQAMADVGITATMYRAPYGAWNHTVFEAAASAGLRPLDWSVDPRDWARPGVSSIVRSVMSHTHTGSIILDHDGGGDRSQTVAAMRIWLPRLLAAGYTFTTP